MNTQDARTPEGTESSLPHEESATRGRPTAPRIDTSTHERWAETLVDNLHFVATHGRHPVYLTMSEHMFDAWFDFPWDAPNAILVWQLVWQDPRWGGIAETLNTLMRQEIADKRTEFYAILPSNREELDEIMALSAQEGNR